MLARCLEVAVRLATTGANLGAAEAVSAFRDGYRPADEAVIAAVPQPVALTPWGWLATRKNRGLRHRDPARAARAGHCGPEARLERFRGRTVLTEWSACCRRRRPGRRVSDVDPLGTWLGEPGLYRVAVLGSAVTYFAAARASPRSCPSGCDPLRGSLVELSAAFVGVAMPPTVGHAAVNARDCRREGVGEGSISAAVTLFPS